MPKNSFAATALIDAPAEEIYAVLADYHNAHPHVMPPEYLRDLEVEQGGYGAGTVIHFWTYVMGVKRFERARVSEPEPGRVLMEVNTISKLVTTFTVTPTDEGRQAHLRIATEWEAKPFILGTIEKALYTFVMRPMYDKELKLIAAFIKNRHSVASSV
jgi:hypothetical protein